MIGTSPGRGLCTKPNAIHTGLNSGYAAINLAYHLGAERIVLCGYNMQHIDGQRHWHGDHPKGLTNADGIGNWVKHFTQLAHDLEYLGIEVINATEDTALRCFKRMNIDEALQC